ncbi:MAG: hypothetical protein OHK0052_20410 [Anaerolineales bacterium]
MHVLLIGSGGREHALAWKLAQSARLTRLFTLPGNPGTAEVGENLPGNPLDVAAVVAAAHEIRADLVVIGPEDPLAAGLADALRTDGFAVYGPSRAAAQLEASKAFAKAFMTRHGIPTASYRAFTDYEAARAYLAQVKTPIVLKASGLAAGKGVVLPNTLEEAQLALQAMMLNAQFGTAGSEVVIEERLTGREVSLLAFCDGNTLAVMPPAQDHKRLLDGDQGPNTGGMGVFAPSPFFTADAVAEAVRTILQPTLDGLRAEGMPLIGTLYAGLMLTPKGVRVLEFNVRFGDPETQVILPLLESDLLEVLLACANGTLAEAAGRVRWHAGAAVGVTLASAGYPGAYPKGCAISGVHAANTGALVFHAGTRYNPSGRLETAGGRVLTVVGIEKNLAAARQVAYAGVEKIQFEGMQFRKDIAPSTAYASAGVDIEAGNEAVRLMKSAVRSTFTPAVLSDVGSFGGLFALDGLQGALVASTDGVGTKVTLAAQTQRYAGVGMDIVNHCINDILVQGARPLFFLDYIASGKLHPQMVAEVVHGMAQACRAAGCALLGGETAEMPGVYAPGHFDIAGTIVGVVARERILPRPTLQAGDVLIGLASSGAHTNGYSLIRKIFEGVPLDTVYPELGMPLADALLAPHRSYLPLLLPILEQENHPIKALAHITGGGFTDNLPRVLPEGLDVRLWQNSWEIPPLFQLMQRLGGIADEEMRRVFNLGIGMVIFCARDDAPALQAALPEETWLIGEVVHAA